MVEYKSLESTSIEMLHETFIDAFSDYKIKFDLPLYKFQQMLQRRGYIPEISLGAFIDKRLVGFVLNGFRDWNGKPTVYDAETGVIKECRKQGITSSMLNNLKRILKENKAEQYLLEVIQTNTSAFNIYKKQGFEIKRELKCYVLDKNKYIPAADFKTERIETVISINWEEIYKFWDYAPSWQNSIDSIKAVPDSFIYSVVRNEGKIIGYGIIDKKTGDIPQIAIDKNYRNKGIAKSILTDLISSTESKKISVLNVDGKSQVMINFLLKSGFENYIDQYEMILKL
jgi:ribosomal protein S18 acetylase RimI-like enzyme